MAIRRSTPTREDAVTRGLSERSTSPVCNWPLAYSALYSVRNSAWICGWSLMVSSPISGKTSSRDSFKKSAERRIRREGDIGEKLDKIEDDRPSYHHAT